MGDVSTDGGDGGAGNSVRTVLVTGATGFIGSHVVAELAARACRVVAADLAEAPPEVRSFWSDVDGMVRTVRLDVEDARAVERLLASEPVDAIVHAAALTSASGATPGRLHAVNVVGTEHVLGAAAGSPRCRRVLLVSSASVYEPPMTAAILSEDAPKRVEGEYAMSKLEAEQLAEAARLAGQDVVTARVAACYGPLERVTGARDALSLVHRAVMAARAGRVVCSRAPATTFDLTYVSDTAAILAGLVTAPRLSWDTYNVSSGSAVSLGELAAAVNRCAGLRHDEAGALAPVDLTPPHGARQGALDVRRASRDVPHVPTSLEEGLDTYAAWLADHDF